MAKYLLEAKKVEYVVSSDTEENARVHVVKTVEGLNLSDVKVVKVLKEN
jgi:hypothetical protein